MHACIRTPYKLMYNHTFVMPSYVQKAASVQINFYWNYTIELKLLLHVDLDGVLEYWNIMDNVSVFASRNYI